MRILIEQEVTEFIQDGRGLSEINGTAILDKFETNQPLIYQAIFGELSDAIAEENVEMANLFLDLCFDVICVYRNAFGEITESSITEEWFNNKISLLDSELKSLNSDNTMNEAFQKSLSERFINRCTESKIQMELLKYLDDQVKKYASFISSRMSGVNITNNFIFVILRLMDDIYSGK